MYDYNYDKDNVNTAQLDQAIRDSDITAALSEVIDNEDGTITVSFLEGLTTEEEATLSALVALHVPDEGDVDLLPVELHGVEEDEQNRVFVRAESRDPHDTTYFTSAGDKWNAVVGGSLGTGDGTTTRFYFGGRCPDKDYPSMTQCSNGVHKEIRNATIRVGGVELYPEEFTIDATDPGDNNSASYYARGFVDLVVPPGVDVDVDADYEWLDIGGGDVELVYDQPQEDPGVKTMNVTFADPIHIKDGVIFFTGGALDAKINVFAVCPAGGAYLDDNGNVKIAMGERVISHYVVDHRLLGDAAMGHYFNVEARSGAMPPGYMIRCTVDPGSATDLKAVFRLELNRERTHVK